MKIINALENFEGTIPSNLASVVHQHIAVNMRVRNYPLFNFSFKRFGTRHWNWHLDTLLDEVPVYLVTTDQAGMTIDVCGREVVVPRNHYVSYPFEKLVDMWFDEMQEKYACSDHATDEQPETFNPNGYGQTTDYVASALPAYVYEPATAEPKPSNRAYCYCDPYGVYRRNPVDSAVPAEIFIWVDRVKQALDVLDIPTVDECGEPRFCPEDNWFGSVLQFVVQMEYAHYLADPRTYNAYVHPDFDVNSHLYQYYESVNITHFALDTMDANGNDEEVETVELFIARMPEEYAAGGKKANAAHDYHRELKLWLADKVMFDDVTFDQLRCLWYEAERMSWGRRSRGSNLFVTPFYPRVHCNYNFDMHLMYMCDRGSVYCFSDDITNHRADRHWHICSPGLYENHSRRDDGLFIIKGDLESAHRLHYAPYFAVKMVGSKWGAIDADGRWITPLIYDTISSYDDRELIEVGIDNGSGMKYGVVHSDGRVVVPVMYDSIESPDRQWTGSGTIKATLNGVETLYTV